MVDGEGHGDVRGWVHQSDGWRRSIDVVMDVEVSEDARWQNASLLGHTADERWAKDLTTEVLAGGSAMNEGGEVGTCDDLEHKVRRKHAHY